MFNRKIAANSGTHITLKHAVRALYNDVECMAAKAMAPKLRIGNCALYALKFKLCHPSARVFVVWNHESNVPSFRVHYGGFEYRYKRRNTRQCKWLFKGRICVQKISEKNLW